MTAVPGLAPTPTETPVEARGDLRPAAEFLLPLMRRLFDEDGEDD